MLKTLDSYFLSHSIYIDPKYEGKTLDIINIVEKQIPEHYRVQKIDSDVVISDDDDKETTLRVIVHFAPSTWYGSSQGYNIGKMHCLSHEIQMVDSLPKDYTISKIISLPNPIPVDKPLVDSSTLSEVPAVCAYNAGTHCLIIYRHKFVAALQKLYAHLCTRGDETLYYSSELMSFRISEWLSTTSVDNIKLSRYYKLCSIIHDEEKSIKLYRVYRLCKLLPNEEFNFEDFFNLLIISLSDSKHILYPDVTFTKSATYHEPLNSDDRVDMIRKFKSFTKVILSFKKGLELLDQMLLWFCNDPLCIEAFHDFLEK